MIWMNLANAAKRGAHEAEQRRVLLVEDDYLVGVSIKTMLERDGWSVIGPIASLKEAMATIDQEPLDAAVLDINIIGGTSVPLAERLRFRDQPFIFVTGYQSPRLPEMLQEVRRLSKPLDERALSDALREALE